ncbi:MAG: Type 3 secretion system secretin [Chroococcopsis gigantea SAG 12.99]|nr:Type 3 secretion system secretin [Chroococcopsis gigantea SAG 12.99]
MKLFKYLVMLKALILLLGVSTEAVRASQLPSFPGNSREHNSKLPQFSDLQPVTTTGSLNKLSQKIKNLEIDDSKTLLTQATPPSNPVLVPRPEIIIEGNKTGSTAQNPNIPALPRAVAPPVGDIAISNIDASLDRVKFATSIVVPRVLLREASAREVLMTLANYAGYNVVFTSAQGAENAERTVSLEFTNESVEDIFNAVLMVSGLQANVQGRTVFVGAQLPQEARNIISRTMRLNQVNTASAATFLAGQGAEFQRLVSRTEDIVDPLTGRIIGRRDRPSELEALAPSNTDKSRAPLLLTGLRVAADERLNSITLIGEPRKVQIASSLLLQLDARRRQVVVNVKVIDINLLNTDNFNSSFAFGFNDGYFVQDNGAAVLNFGNMNPPPASQVSKPGGFAPPVVPIENLITGGEATITPFFDYQSGNGALGSRAPFGNVIRGFNDFADQFSPYARPSFGRNNNPFQPGVTQVTVDPQTGQVTYTYGAPTLFQYPQKFLATLQASIVSGNAKILTDPSLVVQEGQQATVKLTQKVIESVNTQVDPLSGVRTTTPVLSDAGLTLTVNVDRIDDNGFVNLSVSPTVASPGPSASFDSGGGTVNQLTLLSRRELTSGQIRLRDGQSLILSGIIQETDRSSETKVPILGDIPILGALFRSRTNQYGRNEVIILLTPKVVDDNPDSALGYNYTPGTDAAEILRKQGFPVQPKP